eukprot:FR736270.1.p2 GENE.FR736270.1~~FR736270.1.p2  ORF type:complete len:133 (-),score=40.68 FR736270.1:584-982(-)
MGHGLAPSGAIYPSLKGKKKRGFPPGGGAALELGDSPAFGPWVFTHWAAFYYVFFFFFFYFFFFIFSFSASNDLLLDQLPLAILPNANPIGVHPLRNSHWFSLRRRELAPFTTRPAVSSRCRLTVHETQVDD